MKRAWLIAAAAALIVVAAMVIVAVQSDKPSPYADKDINEFEHAVLTLDQDYYESDVEQVVLTLKNNAEDGVVILGSQSSPHWYLERETGKGWYTMRTLRGDAPALDFNNIVNWGGQSKQYTLEIARNYSTPLEPGKYRIVIPDSEWMHYITVLAVEFTVE